MFLSGDHTTSSPARGGGSLASTGVHTMDLGVWFLGCPPLLSVEGRASARFADLSTLPPDLEAVRDTYDVEDLVSGYVTFADDVTLSVESMWLAPPTARDNGVDVWGTEGFRFIVAVSVIDVAGRRLRRCDGGT